MVNAPSPGLWVPHFVELKRDGPDAVRFPANVDRSAVNIDRAGHGCVRVCRHRAMLSRLLGQARIPNRAAGLKRGCEASSELRVTPTQSLKSSCAPHLFNGVRRPVVTPSGRAAASAHTISVAKSDKVGHLRFLSAACRRNSAYGADRTLVPGWMRIRSAHSSRIRVTLVKPSGPP
jgi:hypothetical protein